MLGRQDCPSLRISYIGIGRVASATAVNIEILVLVAAAQPRDNHFLCMQDARGRLQFQHPFSVAASICVVSYHPRMRLIKCQALLFSRASHHRTAWRPHSYAPVACIFNRRACHKWP